MQISSLLRVASPIVGLGLVLGACSSSGTSTATGDGGSPTTTAAAGATPTTAAGDGASGAGDSAGDDLCASVPADQVAEILGADVAAAEPLTASDRFRSGSTLPGCKYLADPSSAGSLMVASAEVLACSDAEEVFADTTVGRVELSGVGDRAQARADLIDSTRYIDTISESGDRCLYVRIFQGAPEAQAAALTNALLG